MGLTSSLFLLRESRSFGGPLSRGWAYNLLSPALHMNYPTPLPQQSTHTTATVRICISLSIDLSTDAGLLWDID
jgi:hypothetical protein